MSAYRDDLEAALQRGNDLEREIAALRARNQALEASLASGDTSAATTNAQRIAAAIAREQEEQRLRDDAERDERAARERAMADRARGWRPEASAVPWQLRALQIVLVIVASAVGLLAHARIPPHGP
jgi:hypothetical protein